MGNLAAILSETCSFRVKIRFIIQEFVRAVKARGKAPIPSRV